jgi:hypothetical protein
MEFLIAGNDNSLNIPHQNNRPPQKADKFTQQRHDFAGQPD